jgi:hypothetical protein
VDLSWIFLGSTKLKKQCLTVRDLWVGDPGFAHSECLLIVLITSPVTKNVASQQGAVARMPLVTSAPRCRVLVLPSKRGR